ncbi:hypothetical protein [Bradyrhizobium sp. MOS003]|jgi:hypothetical protein|uniref:hypothetical protein n=1 Tax=Bradyrhizobium sp. MOS003 TaxID=2133946 RepID=UPI001FDFF12E|nr:hypothetical protein [Bradyrhizobium sp. MOS003]
MPASLDRRGASSAWDWARSSFVLVEGRKRLLHRAHPTRKRRHVARDVPLPVSEVVLAVVGLEVVQGAFELVLAVADFGEDRLDRAALVATLPTISRNACWRRRISAS